MGLGTWGAYYVCLNDFAIIVDRWAMWPEPQPKALVSPITQFILWQLGYERITVERIKQAMGPVNQVVQDNTPNEVLRSLVRRVWKPLESVVVWREECGVGMGVVQDLDQFCVLANEVVQDCCVFRMRDQVEES